jgi:sterol desaturase/sphingolipid hydroxylase (fatty acid hydroxylase superfamily)
MEQFLNTDFTTPANGLLLFAILTVVVFLRYVLVSGPYHYFVYQIFGKTHPARKTHLGNFKKDQVRKEIYWSGISSLIFAAAGVLMVIAWQKGKTAIYVDLHQLPYWYLPISLFVAMFIHETYYYWLHRWMHRPKIFKWLHRVHHDSIETNSWTSFSFHPTESVLQAIIVPLIVLFLPMNIYVLLLFLVIMTVSAVINHAGIEVFPRGADRHWLGKWFIGATHHDLHHKRFRYNYGLYFTFWDRWMNTEYPEYEQLFDEHTSGAPGD